MSPRDDLHLDPELMALLALGETPGTPDEIAAARAHLAACGACAAEVDELAAIARQARQVTPADALVPAPPAVWDAIAAETGMVAATAADATTLGDVVPMRRRRTSWLQLAAAACVGLIVGGGAVFAATSGSRAPAPVAAPSVLAVGLAGAARGLEGLAAASRSCRPPSGPRVAGRRHRPGRARRVLRGLAARPQGRQARRARRARRHVPGQLRDAPGRRDVGLPGRRRLARAVRRRPGALAPQPRARHARRR